MKKFARKVRKAVKAAMPKYYAHLDMEMNRRMQAEKIAALVKNENHEMAKTINQLADEKAKALCKIDEMVANAVELAKQRDSAESKILSYMESANMHKCENEDLRVKCDELEEMLRKTEGKLEIANKEKLEVLDLNEQILKEKQKVEYKLVTQNKDITKYQETIEALQIGKQNVEAQTNTYFNDLVKSREEKRELESRIDYWKEAYKNVCLELEEAKKHWWEKLFRRGN